MIYAINPVVALWSNRGQAGTCSRSASYMHLLNERIWERPQQELQLDWPPRPQVWGEVESGATGKQGLIEVKEQGFLSLFYPSSPLLVFCPFPCLYTAFTKMLHLEFEVDISLLHLALIVVTSSCLTCLPLKKQRWKIWWRIQLWAQQPVPYKYSLTVFDDE